MTICAALLMGTLSGCPLVDGFFIHVINNAVDIEVSSILLRDFNARQNVSANLLCTPVAPESERNVLVPMADVDTADALRIRVEGTNPQEPIRFAINRAIDGGFAANKTVVVTVEGSPTQSVRIQVDPS